VERWLGLEGGIGEEEEEEEEVGCQARVDQPGLNIAMLLRRR